MANLEPGSRIRDAIRATAARRSRVSRASSRAARPRRCMLSTAATWPCGRERVISSQEIEGTAAGVSPFSAWRKASMWSTGKWERFDSLPVAHLAVFPKALAQQDRRGRVAIGDHGHVHADVILLVIKYSKQILPITCVQNRRQTHPLPMKAVFTCRAKVELRPSSAR
jgi:hypothetical protein